MPAFIVSWGGRLPIDRVLVSGGEGRSRGAAGVGAQCRQVRGSLGRARAGCRLASPAHAAPCLQAAFVLVTSITKYPGLVLCLQVGHRRRQAPMGLAGGSACIAALTAAT